MTLHSRCAFLRTVLASAMLVGPALVAAAPTGYMRCYEARRTKNTPKLVPVSVTLQDQFNSATSTAGSSVSSATRRRSTAPSSPGVDQTAHLTCYAHEGSVGDPEIQAR